MKESVASFEKRTGLPYAPPAFLRAFGRHLGPRESCPTLFRYPGPEGISALLRDDLRRLGPPGRDWVWLAGAPTSVQGRSVGFFGTVAVLEPLRLGPCATPQRGIYVAVNRDMDDLVWVPPSAVRARIAWDRIRDAEEARRRFGRGYAAERSAVTERLSAYLEEMSALRKAGAPGPSRPWCSLSARERRRLLERHGVPPKWT